MFPSNLASRLCLLYLVSLCSQHFQIVSCGLLDVCITETCRQFDIDRSLKQLARNETLKVLRLNFLRSDIDHSIGNLPFHELVHKLQTRQLLAVQALSAFIGRAVNATDEFNCVTEFVPDAMKWAIELDSLPFVKGPLHGVPFCVKDDHQIKGMDTTLGCSQNLFKPANSTATLVKIFRELGAIPFCKTNVPQTLVSFGSDNPIYGTTLNPLNKKLSPAGSSSGSGCIVGSKAIHFATGTDAMGSGRLPAHFNGIASIMPTSRRLSMVGITKAIPKMIGIDPVPALFADKPRTLAMIFKALTENNIQNSYDPTIVPMSWRTDLFEDKRPLRFGYLTSIPFFPTMGDTPLVVEETKRRLEALGHTVVPFELPDGYRFMKLMMDLTFADGGNHLDSEIQHDQIATAIKTLYFGLKVPHWQKKLVGAFPVSGRIQIISRAGVDTATSIGLQEAVDMTKQLSREILHQMGELKLDLLLTPVFPVPAVRLDDPSYLILAVPYVALWNMVDFPAGIIPMGIESGRYINATDANEDFFLNLARTNLKEAVGMPIGVQIVGKPFEEELILRALNELESNKSFNVTFTKAEDPK